MIYDSQSFADVLDLALSLLPNDTNALSQALRAAADSSQGRLSSALQKINSFKRSFPNGRRELTNLRQDVCSTPETNVVFEPASLFDRIRGVHWKAEVLTPATGESKALAYANGDIESLRHASGNFSAALQGACKQVRQADRVAANLESKVSHLYLVVEDYSSHPSQASLASRLDPRIQVPVYRAGLHEIGEPQECDVVGSLNESVNTCPAATGVASTMGLLRWDHVVSLLYSGVNILWWYNPLIAPDVRG